MKDSELRPIIYALTLQACPQARRGAWRQRGFRRFHRKGDTALFDYWKARVARCQKSRALAAEVYAKYLTHLASRQSQLPSVITQVSNLAGAIFAETAAVVGGKEPVTEEEKTFRLSFCLAPCKELLPDEHHPRCLKCGCYLKTKTALRSQKCPIGKW